MVRQLPSAPEAEASLLGNILIYPNSARLAIEDGLQADDFFTEANRNVFDAVSRLYAEGSPVDITTVATRLKDTNMLDKSGGYAYLTTLGEASVASANTKKYIEMLKEKSLMRKMITTAENIAQAGYEGQASVDEYLDNAEKKILEVSHNRSAGEFKDSTSVMNNVISNIQKMSETRSDVTGLQTGFHELDMTLHGLQRGDLDILAARPSMGKTAVMLNLAMNVARYNKEEAVAIFSLEMGAEQLGMRFLSALSSVKADNLKTGKLSNEEWAQINEAYTKLCNSKLYIDDNSQTKVSDIAAKARRLQAEQGLGLIVIDYIQLIVGDRNGSGESRQQEVSNISRGLKGIARELNVPVIALSQLSRSVEQRENKRPMLSDLRESGAIEQDADVVMMLYRDSYYNEQAKEEANRTGTEVLEVNIAKHRNGATRKVELAFQASTNAILNISSRKEMDS